MQFASNVCVWCVCVTVSESNTRDTIKMKLFQTYSFYCELYGCAPACASCRHVCVLSTECSHDVYEDEGAASGYYTELHANAMHNRK